MIQPESFDLLEHISLEDQRDIVQSITEAEFNTTGEIRVHIESTADGDAQERAKQVFEILEMHKTEARNGVLFYLAVCDRCFAIIGDKGIHEKVTDAFWDEERKILQRYFKQGLIAEGLNIAIAQVGEKLSTFFPSDGSDPNELSNEISTFK